MSRPKFDPILTADPSAAPHNGHRPLLNHPTKTAKGHRRLYTAEPENRTSARILYVTVATALVAVFMETDDGCRTAQSQCKQCWPGIKSSQQTNVTYHFVAHSTDFRGAGEEYRLFDLLLYGFLKNSILYNSGKYFPFSNGDAGAILNLYNSRPFFLEERNMENLMPLL